MTAVIAEVVIGLGGSPELASELSLAIAGIASAYLIGQSAVDARKRRRIRKAARYYLSHYPTRQYAVRYDIVAVLAPNGSKPQIKHITAAFSSSPDPEGL